MELAAKINSHFWQRVAVMHTGSITALALLVGKGIQPLKSTDLTQQFPNVYFWDLALCGITQRQ